MINDITPINFSIMLPFEEKFYSTEYVDLLQEWISDHLNYFMFIAIIYVILVIIGREYMKNRQKLELRTPLIVWNLFLSLFSFIGAIRLLPELYDSLTVYGFEHSVCNRRCVYGSTGLWCFLFLWSKIPELFDTVFIILRKQPLIFLHYYHHATVLLYCAYSYQPPVPSTGRYFVTMNYCVHALMYGYYALKAMKIRVPQVISKSITSLQLIQMIIGCVVNYYAWTYKMRNKDCGTSFRNIKFSMILYFSYFILFFQFFVNAYFKKPNQVKKEPVKSE